MSRLARIVSTALITAGLVVLADVGLTLAYREPVSSLYGHFKQNAASDQLAEIESRYPTAADRRAISQVRGDRRKVRVLAHRFASRASPGEAIGRIVIPRFDLDAVAVEGTDSASLQRGPGHYPGTRFPGEGGTAGVAGHRTTYLAPFRHIDSLGRGDRVRLEMPYATIDYTVERTEVVDAGDVGIVRGVGYERLVLTACHPLYSAAQRYAVFARATRTAVFDAARGGRWPAN